MSSKRFVVAIALAGLFGLALTAGSAQAGFAVLGNSGWTASWNDVPGTDYIVALHTIAEGQDRVSFKKVATFGPERVDKATGVILPIEIVFQQTTFSASQLTVVNSEFITNQTGKDWTGFQFSVVDGTTGTTGATHFDKAATGEFNSTVAPFGFHIEPFTTGQYGPITSADQNLVLTGGTVANGAVWSPGGGGTRGQLVINANPTRSGGFKTFVFEEQPISGVVIPLPAAAWTGLSGLIGLGLFGAAKKVRSLIA